MFFASLGLSGVGFAAVGSMSKYSDLFGIVTVILLGVSHWMARRNQKRLNKVILWTSTVLVAAILIYGKRAALITLLKG